MKQQLYFRCPECGSIDKSYFDLSSDKDLIYFIQDEDTKYIKIGHSRNLRKRLTSMQTGSSSELKLLAWEDASNIGEKQLHSIFSNCRVRGEWFKPTVALLTYINELLNKYLVLLLEID